MNVSAVIFRLSQILKWWCYTEAANSLPHLCLSVISPLRGLTSSQRWRLRRSSHENVCSINAISILIVSKIFYNLNKHLNRQWGSQKSIFALIKLVKFYYSLSATVLVSQFHHTGDHHLQSAKTYHIFFRYTSTILSFSPHPNFSSHCKFISNITLIVFINSF